MELILLNIRQNRSSKLISGNNKYLTWGIISVITDNGNINNDTIGTQSILKKGLNKLI